MCVFCLCQPICLHIFSSMSVYYFYVWCNKQENAYVIFAVEIFLLFWICSNKSDKNLLKPGENWSTVWCHKMKMLEMNIGQINYPYTMVSTQAGVTVLMPAEPCLLYRFAKPTSCYVTIEYSWAQIWIIPNEDNQNEIGRDVKQIASKEEKQVYFKCIKYIYVVCMRVANEMFHQL